MGAGVAAVFNDILGVNSAKERAAD